MKNPVLSGAFKFKKSMRYFILFIVTAITSTLTLAQSLTVTESSVTARNGVNQYTISGHQIAIEGNDLRFAGTAASSSVNNLTAISAVLKSSSINIHAGNGDELFSTSFNIESDDASAKIYAKLNGGFVVRENIANFLFYNSLGSVKQSISNSSQSTEGESISELASDPAFRTVVLYNPKVVSGGVEGSRAKVVNSDLTSTDIYYSSNRAIRTVKVSDNGQFIAIATYSPGTDNIVVITDRFGNDLAEINFDQSVEDVVISEDGGYVTIRSNGRMGVYSVRNGERNGSASFRSTLLYAEYVPEDQTVVALTGSRSGSALTGVEVHVINVAARAIQRQSFNTSLSMTDLIPLSVSRKGTYRYSLSGLSKTLDLNASF
ncbi:hypothetical protein [Gracilimonas halophila]|uniref:Uncharacterized protein n=1 Tax=Gracilimonas halophila TaxID=1834464 RepID=A0ABW5JNS5_9BACT